MGKFLDFYKISSPSPCKVSQDKVQGRYRNLRMQTFLAATFGYALYYVCRTSLNVMKQPIIDSGFLTAGQLGLIGACLYWTYAVGKFVNGFLADHCNIKKFMATGLVISAAANFIMGILGVSCSAGGASGMAMFICFAIMWGINGWSQSMGAPPAIISLSRWFPLDVRGTWYGFFSASHNFGEGLSFIFVSLMVSLEAGSGAFSVQPLQACWESSLSYSASMTPRRAKACLQLRCWPARKCLHPSIMCRIRNRLPAVDGMTMPQGYRKPCCGIPECGYWPCQVHSCT